MGILNVTPDSFSDGGLWLQADQALAQARQMLEEGARLIDVGGESTRPGAAPVSEQEELDRVVPIIERLRRDLDCVISVDSMKPAVMRAAVAAGAGLINDVNALRAEGAVEAAAQTGAAVCLMHMQGEPRSMQAAPHYQDVLAEVHAALGARVAACLAAGIPRDRLLVDPGIGFGKSLEHNLRLLARLDVFADLGCPLLLGVSRKSLFGKLLGLPVGERLIPSVVTAALAIQQGAAIIRAHDVRATVQAVQTAQAIRQARRETQ
ncbi:dihydropteroate synthase [Stagnimonas aquatica]|uniref:dihydropteroate synthase n=1 Tax=Stagnimonas aquatica TaxID=2689987 RepID=A0A3N0VE07_9GAMM|nr:dihydropteroate synthase [Stagnimonas aquatica]